MEVIGNLQLMQERSLTLRKEGKIIGFVPTMGYLHEGHLSLIRKAREETEIVVVSIYVNPTQFGPGEDFDRYPRDLERDRNILENERVDILFAPSDKDMYPPDFSTYVEETKLSQRWEGERRPGHFRGVTTIVAKLFNIVLPHRAYFGEKDWQQAKIIKRMVRDLNFPVEIIVLPTVREKDGLAASSRNTYLSEKDREKALCLYKALHKIKEMVELEGIRESDILLKEGKKIIENTEGVKLQYLEAVNLKNLNPVKKIKKGVMVAGAIKIGKVRLIDNIIF